MIRLQTHNVSNVPFPHISLHIEIREAFHMFDKNGDGHISQEELGAVMVSLGQTARPYEIREYIRAVDNDREWCGFSFLVTMSQ